MSGGEWYECGCIVQGDNNRCFWVPVLLNLLIGAAVPTVPFDVSSKRLDFKTGPYFGKGLNVFIRIGGHFVAITVQQDAAIVVQLP